MRRDDGMRLGVQRALGIVPGTVPEVVVCGCGTDKVFAFNAIGRMLERCPRCRTERTYRAIRQFESRDDEANGGR